MAGYQRVASVSEVPAGEMTTVEVDGEEVVVANVGGKFVAFQSSCTHKGGPLGEGMLIGDTVECPFHGGQFNVHTGEVVAPPPTEPIKTYAVQVDGDDISVSID